MNEKHIWDFLLQAIGNPFGAAGLMGNLYAESALNPRNLQNSFEKKLGNTDDSYTASVDMGLYKNFVRDGAGYGLAQWTYWTRKDCLLAYANKCGVSIGDLDMQLCFLMLELRTNYGGVLDALRTAQNVREASDAVLLQYERPKDQSEAVRVKRAGYGQRYYDAFQKPSPMGKVAPLAGSDEVANQSTNTNGGDTMQSYDKYIYSTGTHYISNSGKDENNQYHGGKAGDQSGHEWELKKWYSRPWTVVLRYPDADVGLLIAKLACAAALNDKVGYDQDQRATYWEQLKKAAYDPSRISVAAEDDCTSGVSANVKAAGALLGIKALEGLPLCTSRNMRAEFTRAGFMALTASKYLSGPDDLYPGDILLYESHHAATNITVGKDVRSAWNQALDKASAPVAQGLSRGDHGSAVTAMQEALLKWDPTCLPKYGADGDFGSETEKAVKAFQEAEGLPVTGVYDEATRAKLTGLEHEPIPDGPEGPEWILATGNVNVRSAPGTDARVIGVMHKGDTAPYQGEKREWGGRDWYLIEFDGVNGWVSSKYAEVTVG